MRQEDGERNEQMSEYVMWYAEMGSDEVN